MKPRGSSGPELRWASLAPPTTLVLQLAERIARSLRCYAIGALVRLAFSPELFRRGVQRLAVYKSRKNVLMASDKIRLSNAIILSLISNGFVTCISARKCFGQPGSMPCTKHSRKSRIHVCPYLYKYLFFKRSNQINLALEMAAISLSVHCFSQLKKSTIYHGPWQSSSQLWVS